jgi:hypothetical protein
MRHMGSSVGRRLAIGFGTGLALLAVQLAVTSLHFRQIDALEEHRTEEADREIRAATRVQAGFLTQALAVHSHALTREARRILAEAAS